VVLAVLNLKKLCYQFVSNRDSVLGKQQAFQIDSSYCSKRLH